MSAGTQAFTPPRRTSYVGPPLLAPALAHGTLFVASLVVGILSGVFSRPTTPAREVAVSVAAHADALSVVAVLQVGAAVALGVFTASVVAALRSRGVRVAGVEIARFGGHAASLLLMLSGLCGWAMSQLAGAVDADAVKALSLLAFATGGPGHVVVLGLLLAGVSVPCFILRLVPRWVSVLGLVLAGIAVLSVLSLVVTPLQVLLPLARFPALVWVVAVAATLLPNNHGSRR